MQCSGMKLMLSLAAIVAVAGTLAAPALAQADDSAAKVAQDLDRLGVPGDVWGVVSPEAAEALSLEPTPADGDWEAAIRRAGCFVTEAQGLRVLSAPLTWPAEVEIEPDEGPSVVHVARVLAATPEAHRSALYAGGWIPASVLRPDGRKAVDEFGACLTGAPPCGAPDTFVAVTVWMTGTLKPMGDTGPPREGICVPVYARGGRDDLLVGAPVDPQGPGALCLPSIRGAVPPDAVPSDTVPDALRCPGPWDVDKPIEALGWRPAEVKGRRTACTLTRWCAALPALPGIGVAQADAPFGSHVLVPAPDGKALISGCWTALWVGARIRPRPLDDGLHVGTSGTAREDAKAATDALLAVGYLQGVFREIVQRQWRVGLGDELSESDLEALAEGKPGPISGRLAEALLLERGGVAEKGVAWEGEVHAYLGLQVGLARRYEPGDLASAIRKRDLERWGVPAGESIYCVIEPCRAGFPL